MRLILGSQSYQGLVASDNREDSDDYEIIIIIIIIIINDDFVPVIN
jgi:hypothetical protein